VRLLLNNLQRYKTILILNDSNTLLLSINGSYLEFRFIYAGWWLFETKEFYALRKKAKIG